MGAVGQYKVGIWLLFAPIIPWSPSAASIDNNTLVGALVIAISILVPMMPGMSHDGMMDESDIPPGWTYSPSTYGQRLPIIALGLVRLFIARYLTAYQMGLTAYAWDVLRPWVFASLSVNKAVNLELVTCKVMSKL
ncbi:hypothetical protein [Asticcacaulis taihuensis]|jgi:hypothetical protein|uniref:hypothetical protein n=1 Tax=Asticcacaulis taihuensis TaxID=260084 RepID=UPI0026EC6D83|nr:hypothetical protein [Asticcacaulis taihuensis]